MSRAQDASGNVTYGAAFSTQPFNNYVVSMALTGQQILELLEQQWAGTNAGSPKVLQVSGLTYTRSQRASAGSKVVPGSVEVGGQPLDPARTYRVAANSFRADGGEGNSVFRAATDNYFGGLDIDALAACLGQHPGYAPQPTDRIDVQ